MILELCGGEPGAVVEAGRPPAWQRDATLRFERLAGLGGADIPPDEAVASLERLGFAVQRRDADARHRRRAVLAQRHRAPASRSTRPRTSIPPLPRAAAEGCARRSSRNAT